MIGTTFKREESQIGYTLIRKPMNWKPKEAKKEAGPISVSNLSSFLINFEGRKVKLRAVKCNFGYVAICIDLY